jgi:hypothetical protein
LEIFIIYGVVLFIIFLALRELNCWYFKLNEMLGVQKEILECLKKENTENKTESEKLINEENILTECPNCHKKSYIPSNENAFYCQYCKSTFDLYNPKPH